MHTGDMTIHICACGTRVEDEVGGLHFGPDGFEKECAKCFGARKERIRNVAKLRARAAEIGSDTPANERAFFALMNAAREIESD